MSKPWEQEWRKGDGKEKHSYGVFHATGYWVVLAANEEDAQFITAAPDMARELVSALRSKSDLVKTPEGQRMRLWLTVEQVQAMAAAVKKAGVPL